ncbi:hypothetical protein HMPREF1008_00253 [Olsenella sp. oral taxon 809 str. F0356]|uniref:YraN family protein n=1 Tax=Olsenella sp. oral taxon 809 TaxID=661086 RepID=UPI000231EFCD|nr:YraN family protein [Olsenella sp. oral taxon 809]EHF02608.1 hypothetical protein HMPREF1008_00253 [Olsenella sp. oral taxon 809 str. F0356]
MEATIQAKVMSGIKTYLERRGFEILEEGWAHGSDSVDFIARDDEDESTLVFISCGITGNTGDGFPEDRLDRDSLERLAVAYLAEHTEEADFMIRFDYVNMLVIGESKALLRHHRNALCAF